MKNLIMKSTLMLIFNLFINIHLFSQTSESVKNRIIDIKKWYAEIQTIGLKNCKTKKYIKYDNPHSPNEKIPFNQTISVCRLDNSYLIRKGEYHGYEWAEDVFIYSKNEKIFFVFIKGNGEAYSYERRYYCNREEKIVQQLDREADGGEELKGANTENKTNINKDIREIIDLDPFNRIQN